MCKTRPPRAIPRRERDFLHDLLDIDSRENDAWWHL